MPYTKQTWADGAGGGTPLSAARLNYIEDGIAVDDGGVQRLADGKLASAAPNTYPAQMVSVHKALAADGWPATGLVVTVSLPSAADFTYTYQVLYPQSATETSNPQIRWATSATAWSSWYTFWHSGNDGYGSGLVASDSDTVDGSHAAAFAGAGHNHDAAYVNAAGDTMTGDLRVYRSAAPTTGVYYFTQSGDIYLYYNGTTFVLNGSLTMPSGARINMTDQPIYLIGTPADENTAASISGRNDFGQRRVAMRVSNGSGNLTEAAEFGMDHAFIRRSLDMGASGVADNSEVYAGSATPLHVLRYTNDGDLISFFRDASFKGSISVSGETVSYNAFVASHYTQLRPGQTMPPPFGVVIADEEFMPGAPGDARRFPLIDGTTTPGDERVYGVWMGEATVGEVPAPAAREGRPALDRAIGTPGRPLHMVASVGLYAIRVTDEGGDIAPGKLLETSSRRYEARRQADSLVRASTMAKARGRVTWATVPVDPALGYKWAIVPCTMPT